MLPWCQLWCQWPTSPSIIVRHNQVVLQGKGRPTNFWIGSLDWLWWHYGQRCISSFSSSWNPTGWPSGNLTLNISYQPSRSTSYPPCSRGRFDVPSVPVMPVPGRVDNTSTVDGLVIGLPVQDLPTAGQPRQNVGTYKDGPAIIYCLPIDGESYDLTFSAMIVSKYAHPVPAVSNWGRFTDYHPHQKLQQCFLAECFCYKSHGLQIILAWMQCLTT